MLKNKIRITIKLFSGLDKEVILENYNPYNGISMEVPKGTRVYEIAKLLHLSRGVPVFYFINERRSPKWYRLQSGDIVSCFKPMSGG